MRSHVPVCVRVTFVGRCRKQLYHLPVSFYSQAPAVERAAVDFCDTVANRLPSAAPLTAGSVGQLFVAMAAYPLSPDVQANACIALNTLENPSILKEFARRNCWLLIAAAQRAFPDNRYVQHHAALCLNAVAAAGGQDMYRLMDVLLKDG